MTVSVTITNNSDSFGVEVTIRKRSGESDKQQSLMPRDSHLYVITRGDHLEVFPVDTEKGDLRGHY
jgi:hypothetical protein